MAGSDNYELVQNDALTATAGTYNYPGKGSPYDEVNREEVIEADKQAFLGNDKLIKEMYNKIVEKIDEGLAA